MQDLDSKLRLKTSAIDREYRIFIYTQRWISI